MTGCKRNHQAIFQSDGTILPWSWECERPLLQLSRSYYQSITHFITLVANKQHFSLGFLFLCSCWLVVSRIFHVLTELLFISLTEMFTQIISPFFVCMVNCMCGGYTHLNMNICVPFVCTCGGQSRTLGVLLNYFLPHCLERRSLTELEVCCPSCVGCLLVLGL